jgi:hypothetical protein
MDRRQMLGMVGGGFASLFGGGMLAAAPPAISLDPRTAALLTRFKAIAEAMGVDNAEDLYHPEFVKNLEELMHTPSCHSFPEARDQYICNMFNEFLREVKAGVIHDPGVRFKVAFYGDES